LEKFLNSIDMIKMLL